MMNCNRLLILCWFALITVAVYAIPAKPVSRTLTLADGTEVKARLVGDEFGHWWVDTQGKALRVGNDGVAYYLEADAAAQQLKRASRRLSNANAHRAMTRAGATADKFKGEKRGLVILVAFNDLPFVVKDAAEQFDRQFNEIGYSDNGHIGSVHDYFYDQSYQQFSVIFDVVGPVTVSKDMAYYGQNDENGEEINAGEMITEAVHLADEAGVDFSKYDWTGDGYVDMVYVIHAGYDESEGGDEDCIWSHEWTLTRIQEYYGGAGPVKIDGVTVDIYATSSELQDAAGETMDPIGTACHEFSHCLGLPDLYDTSFSFGDVVVYWDILSFGKYLNDGKCPPAYSAYERAYAGWLELKELKEPCEIKNMPAITSQPVAYVLYNPANRNEYYLFENRQGEKWDEYLHTKGMIVTHVDYDEEIWKNNVINNDINHPHYSIVFADNEIGTPYDDYGEYIMDDSDRAGDPFPGSTGKTSLTDETTPATFFFTPDASGSHKVNKPITDITQHEDGTVSFKFDMGMGEDPQSGIFYGWKEQGLIFQIDLDKKEATARNRYEFLTSELFIPEKVTYKGEKYDVVGITPYLCLCSSYLTSLTLPRTLKSMGAWIIYGCPNFKTVTCYAEEVPEINTATFTDYQLPELTLYVPAASVEAYKAHDIWSRFGTILPLGGTEIHGIAQDTQKADTRTYDLFGREVDANYRGLKLQNGKLVFSK